jgi:hypothetical protein
MKTNKMNPRTKLALLQNTFVGVPVIIVMSAYNGLTASNPSILLHVVGSASLGYLTSLVFLYASLKTFKVKSKYDG